MCRKWIERVSFLHDVIHGRGKAIPTTTALIVEISKHLTEKIYSKRESVDIETLHIVRKGALTIGFKILFAGDISGADVILHNPENRSSALPVALVVSCTIQIHRETLLAILDRFPEQSKIVREHMVYTAVKRGLTRELRRAATKKSVSFDSKISELSLVKASKYGSPTMQRSLSRSQTSEMQQKFMLGPNQEEEVRKIIREEVGDKLRSVEVQLENLAELVRRYA